MKIKYVFFALAAIVILITYKLSKEDPVTEDKTLKHNVEQWFLLSDSIENFSLLFPSRPEYQEKEIKSEFGFIKGKMYSLFKPINDFNIFYSSLVCKYSGVEKYNENERDDFFNIRRDGAVENFNGEVILEEKIYMNTYEGRKYRLLIKESNTIATMWCYLVVDKLYILNVITPREYAGNEKVYKFSDSFKINLK